MIKFSNKTPNSGRQRGKQFGIPRFCLCDDEMDLTLDPISILDFYDFIKRNNLFCVCPFHCFGWIVETGVADSRSYTKRVRLTVKHGNRRTKFPPQGAPPVSLKIAENIFSRSRNIPTLRESFVSIFPTLMSVPAARWPSGSPDRQMMATADSYCANNNNRYNKLRIS